MRSFLFLVIFLSSFLHLTLSESTCSFVSGRSTIVGDRLYFMGGSYAYVGDTFTRSSNDNSLYWLPLNTSFNVDGLVPDGSVQKTIGPSIETLTEGTFWTDANQSVLYSLWTLPEEGKAGYLHTAYDIEQNKWFPIELPNGTWTNLAAYDIAYSSAVEGGINQNFVTAAQKANSTANVTSLYTFDTIDPQHPNITDPVGPLPDGLKRPWTYVRFGTKGVLVAVGGYLKEGDDQRSMAAIAVYDLDSQKWSQVKATGDFPTERREFCSVISAAPDDSSFQMTIYGGEDPYDYNKTYEDVYVLTMPAFHWLKINDTGNKEATKNLGRTRHDCMVYHDRQMLVFGGQINLGHRGCNESFPAIKLLDLTTFEWQKQFPIPNDTYEVPKPVIDIIGGGPAGGAKRADAFQKDNLKLFSSTIPKYDPVLAKAKLKSNKTDPPPTDNPSSPLSPENKNSPPKNPNRLPQILGGVSGAIALLLITLTILFLIYRKHSRDAHPPSENFQKAELPTGPDHAPFAKSKPTSSVQEIEGDDMIGLGPDFRREMGDERDVRRELCGKWDVRGELEGCVGGVEVDGGREGQGVRVVYELPTRPGSRVVLDGGFF